VSPFLISRPSISRMGIDQLPGFLSAGNAGRVRWRSFGSILPFRKRTQLLTPQRYDGAAIPRSRTSQLNSPSPVR